MNNDFGDYLRHLRLSRPNQVTQEMLAKSIGRSKMTVSQFEQGKNAPPQGDLLLKIINALDLTDEEENKLIFLASKERGCIPQDLEEYFFRTPSICFAIRAAMKCTNDIDWMKIAERIRKESE